VLGLDSVEPLLGVLAGEGPFHHRLCELGQPLGMPAPHAGVPGLLQPLGCEVANRLEHQEAGIASPQEVVVDERGQRVEARVANLLGGLERAAACEDAKAVEGEALVLSQQVVAPADRRRERPLAGRSVSRACAGQMRLAFEALEDLPGREQLRACRCKLDGEG